MSHNIGKNDKQQGIEMAWHGLTEVLPVILLATCFLSTWDVIKRALFRVFVKDGVTVTEETDACEVVCTDDAEIRIGKTVDKVSYTLLPNAKFLSLVQSAMDSIRGAYVASVGSVCDRARVFVSLGLPAGLTDISQVVRDGATLVLNAGGRDFKFYLSFFSSHDKSAPFGVQLSTVCVVCNNTFNAVLHDTDGKRLSIRVPHTKNMLATLANVPAIIDAFFVSAQKFAEIFHGLSLVPISAADAKSFFAGFLVSADSGEERDETAETELSGRRSNQIDRLTSLFVSGKGNAGQNLADVFSAVTDYYSHESSGGENPFKQVASSEFGNGQAMKALAWKVLRDDKATADLIALGAKVLASQPAE